MEPMGLVSRVEEELERWIVLGLLPKDGSLPSEQVLARRQGVSRATARQALLRLAARGLVVQHAGRRCRALPLSEAVTLENLSVMLHGEDRSHPERRPLLEGYFSLKRETMVELLAACCEHASQEALSQLEHACFALQGTGPWEEQRRWAEREFALLRLAAHVADRPGQWLLIRSLDRSFWGMAARSLTHLDCEAIRRWSLAAFYALGERDAQALRRDLPALLQAADAPLIARLAPARKTDDLPLSPPTPVEVLWKDSDALELVKQDLPDVISPNRPACHTGSDQTLPEGASPPEPPEKEPAAVGTSPVPQTGEPSSEPEREVLGPVGLNPAACQTGSDQASSALFPSPAREMGAWSPVGSNRAACQTGLAQVSPTGTLSAGLEEEAPGLIGSARPACQTGSRQPPLSAGLWAELVARGPGAGRPDRPACQTGSGERVPPEGPLSAPEDGAPGIVGADRPACRTGSRQVTPPGAPFPEPERIRTGDVLGRTGLGGAGSPDRCAAGGAPLWSPVPWPLASSPSGDAAVTPGQVMRSPAWGGLRFDDTQACQPVLRVTARPGQGVCTAAERHHARGTRGASWTAVIEVTWG